MINNLSNKKWQTFEKHFYQMFFYQFKLVSQQNKNTYINQKKLKQP